jgi:hypothetical protein
MGILLAIAGLHLASPESSSGIPSSAGAIASIRLPSGSVVSSPDPQDTLVRIDRSVLLRDLSILAHDSMEGRRTGTPGAERARRFLVGAFPDRGLAPVGGTHIQSFPVRIGGAESIGSNVQGIVRGREFPERYIVVTAHFDHLGIRGGETFNGADDNASGVAALLSLAQYFSMHPTRHSLLFVAFDAEEVGLVGAEAFVSAPPVPLSSILMNVNLDMVSRSEKKELYAVGTHHYPLLRPLVVKTSERSRISLLTGHDTPGQSLSDDWTFASDHGPFHQAKIPFVYFGVEDHAGYHTPADTFEAITPDFYLDAVETVLDFVLIADEAGESLRGTIASPTNP